MFLIGDDKVLSKVPDVLSLSNEIPEIKNVKKNTKNAIKIGLIVSK